MGEGKHAVEVSAEVRYCCEHFFVLKDSLGKIVGDLDLEFCVRVRLNPVIDKGVTGIAHHRSCSKDPPVLHPFPAFARLSEKPGFPS